MTTDDRLLTEREVSSLLAISVETLRRWRKAGEGPVWRRLGGSIRYRRQDIDDFVEQSKGK